MRHWVTEVPDNELRPDAAHWHLEQIDKRLYELESPEARIIHDLGVLERVALVDELVDTDDAERERWDILQKSLHYREYVTRLAKPLSGPERRAGKMSGLSRIKSDHKF